MSADLRNLAAVRRGLEGAYGLALEGLTEDQVANAVASACAAGPVPDPPDPGFLERVVNRLPIDESWLFRDDDLWAWLRDRAGPEFLDLAMARARPIRVLSLGCSAGQEAYSLGILFQGLLESAGIPGSAASCYAEIRGIDCSPDRIEIARGGTVNGWSVMRARPDWLRGRVGPLDPSTGRHTIDPTIRAMCHFEPGNLMDLVGRGDGALSGFDLVLCRHVLIYFRAAEAERLAKGLARALDPGAVLVLAAAEAHLLGSSGTLEGLSHLGAARARTPENGETRERSKSRRRRCRSARTAPHPAVIPQPVETDAPPPSHGDLLAAHVRSAIEHASAGRAREAEREARAACFLEPKHLLSRLMLGKALISTDRERGRGVLRELLHHLSGLPQEEEVPSAPGLSMGQLKAAVRLLLGESEGT